MDKLRIGIVGVGFRGKDAFGRMLSERTDAEIAALCDTNSLRMGAAKALLGCDCNCYTSVEQILGDTALDGIIITTPDHTHEAIAMAAIESGKHILVDKPLAITAAGCLRIINAARSRNLEVTVGFNLRHVPVLKKIKDIIDNGDLGELMAIENREFYDGGRTYMSRWNRRSELSGGLWIHKGSHDFDIMNWWNPGGLPVRVSAFAGLNALREDKLPFEVREDVPVGPYCSNCAYSEKCPDCFPRQAETYNSQTAEIDGYLPDLCMFTSDKDTHDNGIALVEYDNNVRVSHLECFVSNFSDRLYTIIGDKGVLTASLNNPTAVELRPRWGSEDKLIHVPPAGEGGHGGSDPSLLADFLNSIRTGARTRATGRDGILSVAVGQAAEVSWREHRTVEISELVDLTALL